MVGVARMEGGRQKMKPSRYDRLSEDFEGSVRFHATPRDLELEPSNFLRPLPTRSWHGGVLACCGEFDTLGWSTCLLSAFCPCISFGWNMNRSYGKEKGRGILWGLLVLFIFVVPFLILSLIIPHKKPGCQEGKKCPIEWSFGSGQILVLCSLLFSMVTTMAIIGAQNRKKMRHRFVLKGDDVNDILLWTCCMYCSLCQETRTLSYNQVEDGAWNGPESLVTIPDVKDTSALPVSRTSQLEDDSDLPLPLDIDFNVEKV